MSKGTGSVYRRGNVWWLSYYVGTKRRRESTGTTSRKKALSILRARMDAAASGQLPEKDTAKLTFGDLARTIETEYETQKKRSLDRLRLSLSHLGEFFDGFPLERISARSVREYTRERLSEGAARATVNAELAALARGFRLVQVDHPSLRVPVIQKLSLDNTRQGFVTQGDMEAILNHLTPQIRPVVEFAFWSGWRKEEILGLTWSMVDREAGTIHLPPALSKNKDGRMVPYSAHPTLRRIIEERWEARKPTPWVFHRDGNQVRDFRWIWEKATKAVGHDGLVFHDLRRSAVRQMERAGVPRSVAMSITGHKTESVYTRYAIADEAAQRAGLEKLAALEPEQQKVRKIR